MLSIQAKTDGTPDKGANNIFLFSMWKSSKNTDLSLSMNITTEFTMVVKVRSKVSGEVRGEVRGKLRGKL